MAFRVCIPTAGTGSRLGELTKYVNKSLVSIANRPTISHLIEQFPDDTEFVIALGYKGHLVREFLELAYPERRFFYAEVAPYEGNGSGLGFSLLRCREYLQQPFIFMSCDTLVRGKIEPPTFNWMGYAERADITPYRTIAIDNDCVKSIAEKGSGTAPRHKPYIGLAGIADYTIFWAAMEQGGATAIQTGEAHGLRALLPLGIQARPYEWFDTGNPEALAITRETYAEPEAPNILEKGNEAIWFIGNNVIKFSDDEKFIANRAKRAAGLVGFIPDITGTKPHMYRYNKAEGHVLSEIITLPLFDKLLSHSQNFWQSHVALEKENFTQRCMKFYKDKTLERVDLFYRIFDRKDDANTINGITVPKLEKLLGDLDWQWLANGLPGNFHGDFHFENILWSEKQKKFTFLDWRQDFGGSLTTGDIYYDLAKLMHGLIICHELIAQNYFKVTWEKGAISYDFLRKQVLVECEKRFEEWIRQQGYDFAKVRVLTGLIYLNIAALHHYPYSLLLYALGKSILYTELMKKP